MERVVDPLHVIVQRVDQGDAVLLQALLQGLHLRSEVGRELPLLRAVDGERLGRLEEGPGAAAGDGDLLLRAGLDEGLLRGAHAASSLLFSAAIWALTPSGSARQRSMTRAISDFLRSR